MNVRIHSVQPVLACTDVATSIAFYQRLGFRLTFSDDPIDPKYIAVTRDDVELHLQWHDKYPHATVDDRPTYRFLVQDVDALYVELRQTGAIDAKPTSTSPWVTPGDTPWKTREFHVRDPDGNGLQFYRRI